MSMRQTSNHNGHGRHDGDGRRQGEHMTGEKNVSQAALAFVAFVRDVGKGKIADVGRKLDSFSDWIGDERFKSSVETVLLADLNRPPDIGTNPEIRVPPAPKWKKPNATAREKGNKIWTAKVDKFNLRVEYKKTKADGVLFYGSIEHDGEVHDFGSEKLNSTMQTRLYNEAIRLIRQGT